MGYRTISFTAIGYGEDYATAPNPFYFWSFGFDGAAPTESTAAGVNAAVNFTIDDLGSGDIVTVELNSASSQGSYVTNSLIANVNVQFADLFGFAGRLGATSGGSGPPPGTFVQEVPSDDPWINRSFSSINSFIDGVAGLPGGSTAEVDYWMDALTGRLAGDTLIVTIADDESASGYDFDDLSLREALELANNNILYPGTTKIKFAPWLDEIQVGLGELDIVSDVIISGFDAESLTLDAGGLSRVFDLSSGVSATISGMTITGGDTTGNGGGIYVNGNLDLINVDVVQNNADGYGGGVYIASTGTLEVDGSTFDNNDAGAGGGAISGVFKSGVSLDIDSSAFMRNDAGSAGGGALLFYSNINGAQLAINNSTFSSNSAQSAGALQLQASGTTMTASITNSTIAYNQATVGGGGGLANYGATIMLDNSILAQNTPNASYSWLPDIIGALSGSSTHNIIGQTGGGGLSHNPTVTGNKVGVDPLLAPLGNYGGRTKTHALKVGSPALDAGKGSLTGSYDQRGVGFVREYDLATSNGIDGYRDIGAFEASVGTTLIVRSDGDRNDSISLPATVDSLRLREALALSTALAGTEVISFDQSDWTDNEIQLSSTWGQLSVGSGVEVAGPGADLLTIAAAPSSRAINISSGIGVTLSGMRITGGAASEGSGIYIAASSPTIDRMQIDGNSASSGGGIYVAGYAGLTLKNSTLWDNAAAGFGGALLVYSYANVTVINSTISGNSALGGGGIYAMSGANVRVVNSTIAYNSANYGGAGGVAAASGSTVRLDNTIVAHNTASYGAADVSGTLNSSSSHNLIGGDAKLRALASVNGLMVHSFYEDSPAIDNGEDDFAGEFDLIFDQIGYDRIIDYDGLGSDQIDIGAYELALADD